MSEFIDRSGTSPEDKMEITVAEYKILVAATHFLNCLEEEGIKNWSGWKPAVKTYNELCNPKKEERVITDKHDWWCNLNYPAAPCVCDCTKTGQKQNDK